MKKLVFLFFIFFGSFSESQAQHLHVYPDYSYLGDTSIAAFISRLQLTLVKRDAAQLKKIIATDIKWSFGAEDGRDSFWSSWNPESKDSQIWETISLLISKGAAKTNYNSDTDTAASYVFPAMDNFVLPDSLSKKFDQMETLVLWADKVNVREQASTGSKIISTVSYEVFLYNNAVQNPPEGWTPVKSLDGKTTGFVKNEFARSPFDYRMFVEKLNGEWKIVCLINGD